MKKLIVSTALISILLFAGCGGSPKPKAETKTNTKTIVVTNFSDAMGKSWKLIDVRIDGRSIAFDRKALEAEKAGEIFTLTFDGANVSGTGSPNRYSAPFEAGEGNKISIKMVRATLMAPLFEPEKLREYDYFIYIQNVSEWNLVNNNLELTSKNENESKIVMVFSVND